MQQLDPLRRENLIFHNNTTARDRNLGPSVCLYFFEELVMSRFHARYTAVADCAVDI